ncbi:dipeptide/oligopeptide/nickel ABC transporter ATP-binding protein [Brevibacillus reuszeri]|uniref:ABC transporter ATP-binding protein n=1 Tax=Brevibacillus reuszeri TaxID=54915 RepID=UPI001B0C300F|nr:ABC transporter ATP-binding protein [Brevibacillus reuszeri]GIO05904.1 dipeptide/oligopeptide/nickel ABC transporter ATP-binding protein [Brevibacillus reuszeri]
MESKNLLEIKDLEVVYTSGKSTVQAVNGISLSLGRKETLGLVGETGAGKTTIALSILRLLPERTGKILNGSVTFDGVPVLELGEAEMQAIRGGRVSMIFQDPMTALNPVIPIGRQIEEALFLHNVDKLDSKALGQRIDEILGLVGIPPERKKEYPHQFSGGMKQRVVIAMALACSPELLIADEPTTALDVTIQAQVLAMMEELKQRLDMSMLMITHDLGIVAKTCDKVAVIYSGEIVEYGTFEDFFVGERHHPYTDGLFGSIPDLYGNVKRLRPIEGMLPDPTNLPAGCKFHPRCPHCMDICKTVLPVAYINGTHAVKCHIFASEEGYHGEY